MSSSIWAGHKQSNDGGDQGNQSSEGNSGSNFFSEQHYAGISDLLSRMHKVVDDVEYIVGKTKDILQRVFK